MYYVSMTDTFMSGWGMCGTRKTNKLIFECESMDEAIIVADNAESRTDQKHVNICSNRPYYNKKRYYTQVKTKDIYPSWYKKGYFEPRVKSTSKWNHFNLYPNARG